MHRRWGWMRTLVKGKQFKVKLLYFDKGKSISMQKHKHRSEIWLFLMGSGKMDFKSCYMLAKKGTAINIPALMWHKFTAEKPTLVLEIQTGRCSEKDIERA